MTYSAAGKLMLFGEYLVLHGAKSLAFPLKFGQTLEVTPAEEIQWVSEANGEQWFHASMNNSLDILDTNDQEVATILSGLMREIAAKNPSLNMNCSFVARANFQMNWGLGSSSTLISLLSQWSGVNAQELLKGSFGGSGYDIACATAKSPIVYTVGNEAKEVNLPEEITEKLLFVYSGNKQNSREEIKKFKSLEVTPSHVQNIDSIIDASLKAENIESFERQLLDSEELLSNILGRPTLKQHIFADYLFAVKSLGAWGGDFFMVTFRELEEAKEYFNNKGYNTMFTYNELVK